jgi:hypothetical protein
MIFVRTPSHSIVVIVWANTNPTHRHPKGLNTQKQTHHIFRFRFRFRFRFVPPSLLLFTYAYPLALPVVARQNPIHHYISQSVRSMLPPRSPALGAAWMANFSFVNNNNRREINSNDRIVIKIYHHIPPLSSHFTFRPECNPSARATLASRRPATANTSPQPPGL